MHGACGRETTETTRRVFVSLRHFVLVLYVSGVAFVCALSRALWRSEAHDLVRFLAAGAAGRGGSARGALELAFQLVSSWFGVSVH